MEIVVPVYNEERILEKNILRLRAYLDERFPFTATVTIADNASTDRTWQIASDLATRLPGVQALHLDEKGRGRALRAAWLASAAEVVAYMDVDLATDLDGLLPLVAPLVSGHSDLAIGTRLAHGSRVQRGPKREVISRLYNLLIRTTMRSGFTDAQCGFKALRADAARRLLPLVADEGWFFDTELLILGEAGGMRIHEVPVDWIDDTDSRVEVMSTAMTDIRGLLRVSHQRASGRARPLAESAPGASYETSRFGSIGGVSTLAYLVLFFCLVPVLSVFLANAAALTIAAVGNAGAHRRLTLPSRSGGGPPSPQLRRQFINEVTVSLLAGLVMSSAFLALILLVTSGAAAYLVAVLAANAIVSAGRFVTVRARLLGHPSPSGAGT